VIEVAAGIFANSLALLTDAAHNLTDVIALGLSWYAVWLTSRPATHRRTYGYHRAGILVALVNSTTLVLISFGIFYEAYRRFMASPEVRSEVLISVGFVAVLVNLVTALLIRRGSETDLNLRSAFTHLMGDVLSTVGAVAAGVIIFFTHANWLDPFVSVLIGFIIIYNAWGILRETVEILLESTPRDVDMQSMVDDIKSINGVLGVHDLHVWSLTRDLRTMSAHVLTEDHSLSEGTAIQRTINEMVSQRYNISHATLQLECVDCEPDSLYCDINEKNDVLLSKNLMGH
jgi:cobalt-zinc-cadmium efflux system protein